MKQKLILLVSVGVGLLAFVLTFQYLRGKNEELQRDRDKLYADAKKIMVWGAADNIPKGTVIKQNDLRPVEIFEASAPDRVIAKEEGRNGIRANSVLLGVIEAGMFLELSQRGVFDGQWTEEVQKTLALKRWGKPEEVAYAAVFLASSKAAYITGHRLSVTGGYAI